MALHDSHEKKMKIQKEKNPQPREWEEFTFILQIKYIQRDLVPLSYAQLYTLSGPV